ncbi:flavodoxin domain-containing protein [Actinospica sp. MGRD01-02]|uniref:Flavodoxin domain-containing protein n=1 Tax=Actinospica acidithermotolerans TaxID=2828514 RepID=A0A941IHD5_9ACTN|nr:flavodoxin domain-containing protein [Actinospica acidithermotolerans]MBR7825073.1 flavodoxin domain-containing protein [Actinospica acidithermotolerans]
MHVLIAYATAHGSTQGIAEHLGKVLAAHGADVEVRSAGDVDAIDGYDVFVIGSAVHDQRWLPTAVDLVRRHAGELSGHPVWLFSVGMPGALRRPLNRWAYAEEPKLLAQFEGVLEPLGHRLLSGVVRPDQLPWTGRLAFRAIGGRYGDYRDWSEIEAWAATIAATSAIDS